MAREWTNIDVLRMEKFLLVTRRYLGASLEVLKQGKWNAKSVKEMTALWEEIPFNVPSPQIPNGMRFHCIDIFVDELERVGALEDEEAPVEELMGPVRKLAKESPTKAVRGKAAEAVVDERLPGNEKVTDEKEEGAEEEWGGIED